MRGLLLTSAVIVFAAVTAPALLTQYLNMKGGGHAPTRGAMAHYEESSARPSSSRSSPRQVVIEAERDGHFYIEAEVNFSRVRLMVDTGATVVALRESDAESAGIRLRPDDFVHPVQTANGTTNAAEATIDSVSVEDVEVRNVRALVLPDDQLSISLLGASFLNGVGRFEVADGTLVIED